MGSKPEDQNQDKKNCCCWPRVDQQFFVFFSKLAVRLMGNSRIDLVETIYGFLGLSVANYLELEYV